MDNYTQQMIEHYRIQEGISAELLGILQRLSPGEWVVQVLAGFEFVDHTQRPVYTVSVTNGDDNVTTTNKNLGAALSQAIYYLLNGSVFPLTGNGGVYIHPADCGWTKKIEGEK